MGLVGGAISTVCNHLDYLVTHLTRYAGEIVPFAESKPEWHAAICP